MNAPAAPDDGFTLVDTRATLAEVRLQLLADTRRQLFIQLPRLTPDIYASPLEQAELRRIATAGRGAEIRLLLHEPAAALRDGHRLIALAQRLPSIWQIRTPVEPVDLDCASACLLNDNGGYLFLPNAERPQGRASRRDRAAQIPLRQRFDETWERSIRARELQTLDL
ncbi:hypothetical protein [Rhodanobacter glycinis]|uniref:DUF7931 domain-containing protein n=1 Tax=Rhodanobacter glycinis TaxID=582702 RepID=A0A1I3Y4G9_9GAMM|nr:hypothetical protein [Rhodanobacter glycinis]SFK26653.1 hypothetical protein SAMN05192579_101315 [Rhodanobacter glycinis]